MRKLHIDLRLSQETVDDLAAGKSVVIEDAEDRFVLIPPQEMDCDYGVHDVSEDPEEEEEEDPMTCHCAKCVSDRKKQVEDDKDDSFEIAESVQKLLEIFIEARRREHEAKA